MSAVGVSDPANKSAKKKKKSKKKANGKIDTSVKSIETNGVKADDHDDEDDDDEAIAESPAKASIANDEQTEVVLQMSASSEAETQREEEPARNGAHEASDEQEVPREEEEETDEPRPASTTSPKDTSSRLDAMQQERDSLRAEVSELRRSLESLQEKHTEELSNTKEELEQTQQSREHAETQYRNLLGKVNTIRSQLGERLKQDAEELEQARGRILELEDSNTVAKEENERLQAEMSNLNSELESHTTEIESLRSRTTASTSNWVKERDELVSKEAYIREEYEVTKQAMQDWEILATDERSRREALEERSQELEEQLNAQREAYERARDESETQSSTVDGLQRALRDLQDERKRELREIVEQSQAQLEELRTQAKGSEDAATELRQKLSETQKELERALPFEKEVKEKNLLIGKLRHEGVILNEHLIKALRFLKRGKPEDNVDRQLVTNHFLHFLALDRSDPKKFQILQLISALLGWTEEQREQAGLLRQGSLAGGLKVPMSPFRRTPSTPSLSTDFMSDSPTGTTSKETLAELWSEFLEREAESGSTAGAGSRRSSLKSARSPSLTSVTSPGAGPSTRHSPEINFKESTRPGGSAGGGGNA